MRFAVLGPIEVGLAAPPVRAAAEPVAAPAVDPPHARGLPLRAPILHQLLGTLLSRTNEVVPVDTLIDALWSGHAVRSPRQKLQVHVHRLRQLLDGPERIVHRNGGYLLRTRPGEVDAERFDTLLDQAHQVAEGNDWDQCVGLIRQAPDLWRGEPYGELAGNPVIRPEAERLAERRLSGLEQLYVAELARGRHSALIADLCRTADHHPLRERLQELRILALYRAGRQAEALAALRRTREQLVEELGVEPGPALIALQSSILAADPSLEPESHSETPSQLPPAVPDFTGRDEQVGRLLELLSSRGPRSAPAVAAIAGPAGVGKTTLAVATAHRLIDQYPDGQLYVDLRGADAGPLDPTEALGRLLRSLGVAGAAIPESRGERSALFRSRLAGTRTLILLDNAAGEQQVRPLLPGRPGCGVLVTSRAPLAGLEGASLVNLDLFTPAQALDLLRKVIGADRVATAAEAAAEIVRLCDQLPLAVRIAAARLARRPDWELSRLAERLADQRHRLDELRSGDLAVRASLELSYQGLGPAAQTTFRRLGLLDVPHFAPWVAATLLDTEADRAATAFDEESDRAAAVSAVAADRLVDELVEARLVEPFGSPGEDRYRFHDLVRLYAREVAERTESEDTRRASVGRALGEWAARAVRASRAIDPAAFRLADPGPQVLAGPADPLGWFDTEHPCLVAAVDQAAETAHLAIACELADALTVYVDIRTYFGDWRHTHDTALEAAHRLGCHRSQGVLLSKLASLEQILDHYDTAADLLVRADRAFAAAADERGRAHVRYMEGASYRSLGEPLAARGVLADAVSRFRRLGDPGGEARALQELGATYLDPYDGAAARRPLVIALAAFRQVGDRRNEALTLRWLGTAEHCEHSLDSALALHQEAGEIFDELGDVHNQAYVDGNLGRIRLDQGRPAEADTLVARSLAAFRTHGDRHGQARALHDLGRVHLARENLPKAAACLRGAVEIWSSLGAQLWQVRSLECLEGTYLAAGDRRAAQAVAARLAECGRSRTA
ncbi:DNA-binding SARP family transcriptional activator [Kribbella amoyensis]|uniref:DNA-binding SARP family transcriptional activator n=1 Tax=Kribbella amoyensis TaxID=996641 RepID=A0A561C1H4_9ACTN|nr:AfsR/SARP family transcriptional regulator [Kribbella amoyensis]TWD84907.1 DNA-binding SARP family transcriptional activator [Kribbella amoyensis]